MKNIEEHCLVGNLTANVVISFNFKNTCFEFRSGCLMVEYFGAVEVLFLLNYTEIIVGNAYIITNWTLR